jgi:hypothetical protein
MITHQPVNNHCAVICDCQILQLRPVRKAEAIANSSSSSSTGHRVAAVWGCPEVKKPDHRLLLVCLWWHLDFRWSWLDKAVDRAAAQDVCSSIQALGQDDAADTATSLLKLHKLH